MKIGPRYKICKRLGSGVFDKCQTQKFALAEERGLRNRKYRGFRKSISDFGKQLVEKQKLRYAYGITEKQLSKYVKISACAKENPSKKLCELLESRLDNAAYRLGIANTRRFARQIVSHGHIKVNGKRVTIPSYSLKKGDKISVREESLEKPLFLSAKETMDEHKNPDWLSFSPKKMEGEVKQIPSVAPDELIFDPNSVIEFYSK